ncbi:hypothetical protein QUF75_10420 [Desulfococcaceae bacterium HSG7]|nr:hypothetical protein [Desulfococcaceae bacterium HSG7]
MRDQDLKGIFHRLFFITVRNEKGMIIAIGLLFLAIIALLSSTAMLITTSDMKYGGNFKARIQASYFSEAGVNEALFRMNLLYKDSRFIGEKPGAEPTSSWHRLIVVGTAAGSDQTATLQTLDGSERQYTVDIRYKKEDKYFNNDADDDEVVLWGQDFGYGPNAPPAGKNPVIVITSAGVVQNQKHTLIAEVTRLPLDIHVNAALSVGGSIRLNEATFISGFNHTADTTPSDDNPSETDSQSKTLTLRGNGVDNHGGVEGHELAGYFNDTDTGFTGGANEDTFDSPDYPDEADILYGAKIESDDSTYLPGIIGQIEILSEAVSIYGHNPWMKKGSVDKSLYKLLGITPDQLQKMLDKADVTDKDTSLSGQSLHLNKPPEGITYLANLSQDVKIRFPSNMKGSGLLYVKGDLDVDQLSMFKGLIYVEGKIELGDFWLLGAVAAQKGNHEETGGGEILYSQAALDENVGNAMKYIILGWNDGRNLKNADSNPI